MIKIKELNEDHVGKWVKYTGNYNGPIERGRIKSWNNKFIFVVYKCADQWDRFKNYTACATRPEDLILEGERG